MTKSCSTETDIIQSATRPAEWWELAEYIAKILLLTRNVGAPQASTSCAWGNARQISRTRSNGDAAVLTGRCFAGIRRFCCFFGVRARGAGDRFFFEGAMSLIRRSVLRSVI